MGRYKKPEATKLSKRVQVLLTPSDMDALKSMADAKNQLLSAFVRDLILEEAKRQRETVIPYVIDRPVVRG